MRNINIGKHVIPLWAVCAFFLSGILIGVLGYHVWNTLVIPLQIKEPLEITEYPAELSLFAGDVREFNVTVQNHASNDYSVLLTFSLDNTTYQAEYVTFSDEIYFVIPGQQNLAAWLMVAEDAPPSNVTLTITFKREVYPYGLVAHWKFDEGSGTLVFDSSGNDNNGLLLNSPVWTDGKYGKALNFDGTDDYVIITDSPSLRVQSFTLAAWIYMTVRPYQAGHPGHPHVCIINKMHFYDSPAIAGYKLDFEYPTATDDTLVISIGDGTAQRFLVQYNSINDLTLNQWHQIIGTYNGTTAKLYIDGELKATGQGSYTILHDSTPLCFSREISQPVYDGFNGIIDNIIIYNRALNAEEVHELFENT